MGACSFLYNSETGEIFTRTPSSWAKIGLFYLVYYTSLAAFFAGLLAAFLFSFTDVKAPVLTGEYSVLPPNPGLGFRPLPDVEKTLVKYSVQDAKSYKDYVTAFEDFLDPENETHTYKKGQGPDTHVDCAKEAPGPASYHAKPCKFLVEDFPELKKNCLDSGDYGFGAGTPCVAIKLNRIFEFIPELENGSSADYLQVKCEGEHAADKDNIGPIEYYPQDGFNVRFFPYLNQRGYISPLVFIKMNRPTKGVLIQVVCKPSNAENIVQNKQRRGDGRVNFEVLIDE